MTAIRFPEVEVELVGQDGNVFNLLGLTSKAMRAAGVADAEVSAFMAEATSQSSYGAVLALIAQTVTVL